MFAQYLDALKRLLGYGGIGATGMVIDLGLVAALEQLHLHYILITVIAYQSAMTWNFMWQRRYIFTSTNSVFTDYWNYLTVDVAALVARLGVVTVLVETSASIFLDTVHAGLVVVMQATPYLPAAPTTLQIASFAGIISAFAFGFFGTDQYVFNGDPHTPTN